MQTHIVRMSIFTRLYAGIAGIGLTAVALPSFADMTPADWVAHALANTNAPGVAAGVISDGDVRIASGGLRAARQGAAISDDDLWHIGSITKSMTATLVARLVEAEEIRWDDTVGDILGDAIADINPVFADLTYVDLLTHRSGLGANIPRLSSLSFSGALAERDMMADRLRYAEIVLGAEPEGERGAFAYSNAGYVVAGTMAQQSTGQTWEALMQSHVFDVLGLASAGFGAPGSTEVVDQPRGHRGNLWVRAVAPGPAADNVPAMGPGGTVHISVDDMLTYLRAHTSRDEGFLSADSWGRLHTPPAGSDYAMGWAISDEGWLIHNGSNTLWYATAGFAPGQDRVAFFATNYAGDQTIGQAMSDALQQALAD